jgi:hypothetical protein
MMINKFFDLIGFNDPFVHKIYEKYGIFSAKLWNVSNIAFRLCLFSLIIGLLLYLIHTFIYNEIEILLVFGVILLSFAQLFLIIGQLTIVIYQILRRDFFWAIGSFFFFVFVFVYKMMKRNEES